MSTKFADIIGARPIFEPVAGATYQPGARVRVVALIDETADHALVGRTGRVAYLEYDCGCGQTFPGDPMIGVELDDGTTEEFWPEELAAEEAA